MYYPPFLYLHHPICTPVNSTSARLTAHALCSNLHIYASSYPHICSNLSDVQNNLKHLYISYPIPTYRINKGSHPRCSPMINAGSAILIFSDIPSIYSKTYTQRSKQAILDSFLRLFRQTVHPDNPVSSQTILGNHGLDSLQVAF